MPLLAAEQSGEYRIGDSYKSGKAGAKGEKATGEKAAKKTTKKRTKSPKAKDVTGLANRGDSNHPLDKPLTYLKGVGPNKAGEAREARTAEAFAMRCFTIRVTILTMRRQVKIKDLVPGDTVTIVATVKRCNCFNSPRNPKLTMFDLTVYDSSSKIKINRFFAGAHFRSRGWQERQKRLYPPGAVVAISGLVKQTKYGINIDNPEIEVLGDENDSIDSLKVGRVVPVYPLTEGVGADSGAEDGGGGVAFGRWR